MGLVDSTIVRLLPAVPKPVVRRLSSRYIAGETLGEALRTVATLNAESKLATIDVLGEEVLEAGQAAALTGQYLDVLQAIEREKLGANVSVKLTALGLKLDVDLCRQNLGRVVRDAGALGVFVRIDMEDATCTDDTLRLYRELRRAGLDNVGIVLQAYLRRTPADVEALADLTPNVRLCKGIYVEPEEIAYSGYEEVRRQFVAALDRLLAGGSYVAVATHDEWLIGESLRLLREHRRGPVEYELQMLLGVREGRASELVADGSQLRVYVPYGGAWHAYSLRRLRENPRMAGYIASDLLNRVVPGRRSS